MAAAKFITKDGLVIYPCYLSKEKKIALKKYIEQNGEDYLWCGCSKDTKLFYKFSSDLKLVPVHHGYMHGQNCPRAIDRRTSGYMQLDSGQVKIYLNFKPNSVNISKKMDREEDAEETEGVSKEKDEKPESKPVENKKEETEKDRNLGIRELAKQITYDTFMVRQGEGKSILSAEYLLSAVSSRLKTVILDGFNKSLRELSLEDDNCRFFYCKLGYIGILDGKYTLRLKHRWFDGTETVVKEKSHFIYDKNAQDIIDEYEETYGYSVEDALNNGKDIIAAGFIVRKTTRPYYNKYTHVSYAAKSYSVIGKCCLFNVDSHGLYVDSDIEENIFNNMIVRRKNTEYILPSEHDKFALGIIKEKSQGYIFIKNRAKEYKDAGNIKTFACQGETPSAEELNAWRDSL